MQAEESAAQKGGVIRPAVAQDAAAVAALWSGMIRDSLATFTTEEKTADDIALLIDARRGAFWVADVAGEVAGFVTFGSFRGGPGYAATVEHSIVLSDSARGQGLGRGLMTRAMGAAAAQGHHVMVAAISSANPGAVAFHEKLGFAQVGHMPEVGRKRDQWLDLILMQKILAAP
ncbi:N-acetyltransferase family protein [Sulfitobacter sp. PS-8MA]|uniref:N-acetyltransferase family protein n=1 Tax=Sulfitobacter sp. PS-8MA TaxID=3237707 RepID=UPI0034C5D180